MIEAKRIAFLGLGAMGRRMARRLIDAGHDVTVWSRSAPLDAPPVLTARAAPSPAAAARGADVVVSMVTDDEASRAVWGDGSDGGDERAGALAALGRGALAIECSTLSPARVVELGEHVQAAGGLFLDAPVVGSRPQAEAGALVFLGGGEPRAFEAARPVFVALGQAAHHLGPTPSGALAKLVVNALFGTQVAALAELFGFARRSGLEPSTLGAALATLAVSSPAANAAASGMLAGRFEPMFPVTLVEKDLRYALAAAEAAGASTPLTGRVHHAFAEAAARGLGGENLTAVSKLYG